jgi:pimeloyl-ACP methyl ester carboxylesterase
MLALSMLWRCAVAGVMALCLGWQGALAADLTTSAASPTRAPAARVLLFDPFLLGAPNLADVVLRDLLPSRPNWAPLIARGIVADDTSAAIVLFASATPGDVSLATANGAVLLPYSPDFLNTAPASGAPTLRVRTALFPDGRYYGAALLQAPPLGAMRSFATPITITASQGTLTVETALQLLPPPVILVHGLWGDLTSLQSVEDYLTTTAPWQGTGIVAPICYSTYLAFDATSDPLSTSSDECEVTSAAALAAGIASVEQMLDAAQIVGGRVDIVAHSMGGLAARNFATVADYQDIRYRTLGAFHEVVTIDTPELGSSLATYLIENAGATFANNPVSLPGLLWRAGGCSFSDTLEPCMATLGMPLTAPGYPLDIGAVYSLEPGGAAIVDLPPAIPNAVFAAIGAIWPDQDQPESLLRNEINTLNEAIYPAQVTPPTTDQILGGQPNDVIVTQDSQVDGPPQAVSVMPSDLAHTGASFPTLLGPLLGGSNGNVLDSSAVNQTVGCLLLNEGGACTAPTDIAALRSNDQRALPVTFLASDRLVLGPLDNATIGEPLVIPVQLSGAGLAAGMTRLVASQADRRGEIATGSGPVSLSHSAAGAFLTVVPQRLGPMKFTVIAWFGDGGAAITSVTTEVHPPVAPPVAFRADPLPVLALSLAAGEPVARLHPTATFPGVAGAVPVPGEFLQYAVVPTTGVVPVEIEPIGLIRALQPGKAAIELRLDSAVAQIPVVVTAPQR